MGSLYVNTEVAWTSEEDAGQGGGGTSKDLEESEQEERSAQPQGMHVTTLSSAAAR
jgi:hypothetical protein